MWIIWTYCTGAVATVFLMGTGLVPYQDSHGVSTVMFTVPAWPLVLPFYAGKLAKWIVQSRRAKRLEAEKQRQKWLDAPLP